MNAFVFSGMRTGSNTLIKSLNDSGIECKGAHNARHFYLKYQGNLTQHLQDLGNFTIVKSYRTPIEQLISIFFLHNFSKNGNDIFDIFDIQKLNKKFIKDFEYLYRQLIEEDLNTFLRRNSIIETDFDYEKKYNKITNNGVTLVTVRFNEISDWGQILSEALGKRIRVSEDNVNYHSKFKEFKEALVINRYIYNVIERDINLKIFLTESERQKYLNYWKQKIRK